MTTFATPTFDLPQIGTGFGAPPAPAPPAPAAPVAPRAPRIVPYSPEEPPEAEQMRAQRAAVVDHAVARNRLATPASVANKRRSDRISVGELNDFSPDELKQKYEETKTDDRGPLETVMDWLDSARSANANIAFGHPTASGILGGFGESAAAFAIPGFFAGGPIGAGFGALAGLGVQGIQNVAALVMRGLTPESTRDEIDAATPMASYGQHRIQMSDALDKMGVKSSVARAILGFAGDVAMDPLTYLGGAGFGRELTAKAAEGGFLHLGLTKSGGALLDKSLVTAAAGGAEHALPEAGAWLAAKGYAPDAVKARLAAGESLDAIKTEAANTLLGKPSNWTIAKPFTYLGHEAKYEGSELVKDFYKPAGDVAGDAAKALVGKIGQGISEPGIRIGVKPGEAGLRLAHIPFTDYTLTLPDIAKANGVARRTAQIAALGKNGIADAALEHPAAMTMADVALKNTALTSEIATDAAERSKWLGESDERIKGIKETPPDAPPAGPDTSGGPVGPAGPGMGPAPITSGAAPSSAEPAAQVGRAVGDGVDQHGRQAGAELGVHAPSVPPGPRSRADLIAEMHEHFADVPQEQRDAAVALADARAKSLGISPEEYWSKTFAGFRKGLPENGEPLYQIDAWHGSPHTFDAFDIGKIGTGEGNQAYGHGLYFATKKGVAEHYRDMLTPRPSLTKDVRAALYAHDNLGFDTAGEAMANIRSHPDWAERWDIPDGPAKKVIEDYLKAPVPKGRVYNVSLAPEDHQLLDLDKTLGEQPQVKAAIEADRDRFDLPPNSDIENGETVYARISHALGGDTQASEYLRSKGILGNKYLDGSSRSASQGTHNYVIFHHDDVAIKQMFQGGHGAVNFLDDGRAIISALDKPIGSTLPHEFGHVFRRGLAPEEQAIVESHYGGEIHGNRELEERYASDFERYLARGKAPTPELQPIFDKFREWLRALYHRIIGTPLEDKLSPEMRQHFDRILGSIPEERPPGPRQIRIMGSRTEAINRLHALTEQGRDLSHFETETSRLSAGAEDGPGTYSDFSATFREPTLPTEAKDALSGKFQLMKHVKVGVAHGKASTFLETYGADKWVEMLERMHGSKESQALRAAAKYEGALDPSAGFYAHLIRESPSGWGVPKEIADFTKMPQDMAFTINNTPMFVTHDDGGAVIHYAQGKSVPADFIGQYAIDKGSAHVLDEAEAQRVHEYFQPEHAQAFDPNGPLFQPDVAGQGGIWGDRVGRIASGEKQGGLFGGEASPRETPAAPGEMVRKEGESEQDFRIRQKFVEAEKNTGTLFQPSLIPHPDDPLAAEQAIRESYEDAYRQRQAARVEQSSANAKRATAAFEALKTEDYARTKADAATMLQIGQAVMDTNEQVAGLRQSLRGHEILTNILPDIERMEPAEIAKQIGPELYKLYLADPQAATQVADGLTDAMDALRKRREILKGQLAELTKADSGIAAYARMVMGTDNTNVALSAFGSVRDQLARANAPQVLTNAADAMDRFARRVFNVKGGYQNKVLAEYKAQINGINRQRAARWQQRVEESAKKIMDQRGVSTKSMDHAMEILHGVMYDVADPEHSHFEWTRPNPGGPSAGKPSLLREMLEESKKSGLLADRELLNGFTEIAQKQLAELRDLGQHELYDTILDRLSSHYIPLVVTPEWKKAIRGVKGWGLNELDSTRETGNAKLSAGLQRMTNRTYFPDPSTITLDHPNPTWKWFHEMDRWLMEGGAKRLMEAGDGGAIVRELAHGDPDKAKVYAKAFDAMSSYEAAVAQDKTFALKYPPKPIDFMEANALREEGRFSSLVAGSNLPGDMFETNWAIASRERIASHERATGAEGMARLFKSQSMQIDPGLIARIGNAAGMKGQLRNGQEVTALGEMTTNAGGKVPAFKIGDDVYRLLDSKTRAQSFLSGLVDANVLNGGLAYAPLADKIEDVARVVTPGVGGEMESVLSGLDAMTNVWKKLAMFRVSRTVVESIGNVALSVAGGAKMLDMVKDFPDVVRVRGLIRDPERAKSIVFKAADGRTLDGEGFIHFMSERGGFDQSFPLEVAGRMAEANPSAFKKGDQLLDKLIAPTVGASALAWDYVRGTTLLSHWRQGNDVEAALRKTVDSLFDWSDYGRVEETLFRRLLPFYSWTRHNLGYQIQQLMERPIYAAATPSLANALQEAVAGNAVVPEKDRPEWMREQAAAQLTRDPNTRIGLMFNQLMPASEVLEIMQPIVGTEGAMRFANFFAGSLNPLASVPLQLATHRDFFKDRSIGADAQSGDESVASFLGDQIGPLGYASGVATGFGRSAAEGIDRTLLGGRIQAMDDARLASSIEREEREKEMRLRGAVTHASRAGDHDTAAKATAALLHLYATRRDRGLDIPKWATARLSQIAA